MSERKDRPAWDVGDVEQEAARLVDAARAWLAGRDATPGADPGQTPEQGDVWAELTDDPREAGPAEASSAQASPDQASPEQASSDQASSARHAEPCTACPWCRARAAAAAAGRNGEVLDGVADLLGAAAQSLRLLAAQRRARGAGRPQPGADR